jgi:hypothetical protein
MLASEISFFYFISKYEVFGECTYADWREAARCLRCACNPHQKPASFILSANTKYLANVRMQIGAKRQDAYAARAIRIRNQLLKTCGYEEFKSSFLYF